MGCVDALDVEMVQVGVISKGCVGVQDQVGRMTVGCVGVQDHVGKMTVGCIWVYRTRWVG